MVNTVSLSAITERTTTLIRAILAQSMGPQDFKPGDPLVDVGLTSLDLVNLMIALEGEFDILLPPAELNLQNFYSAASIARMMYSVLSAERSCAAA